MTRTRTLLLVAPLLAATGLSPAAYAQDSAQNSSALAQQGQSCEALTLLIEENPDRFRPDWVQQADAVVRGAVVTDCATWYEAGETALAQQDSGEQQTGEAAEASAQIVVTQPDAEVSVQQSPPEVSVTQPQPQVSVDQGRPDVLVRQTPPNVTVQVPQPIITIDQPAPEIIITMPEPDVNVTTPEPQVEVRQAQPTVSVEQAEPQVRVQAQEGAGDDGEADVTIQQGEANVTTRAAEGEAQVDIRQQEPVVRFEPAQPNVQVQSEGEPEIRFGQSGEPNIQVRRAGEEAGATGGTPGAAPDTAPGAAGAQGQTDAVNQPGSTATGQTPQIVEDLDVTLGQSGEPMEPGQMQPYNVADLVGQTVVNGQGQELGTVERVVDRNGRDYVVLARGGLLGFGEREVGLPLDSISVVDGRLLMRGLSEQDLQEMPEFTSQGAREYGQSDRVEIGTP